MNVPDFRDILTDVTSRAPDKAFSILIRWLNDISPDDILNGKTRAWTPDLMMGRIEDLFLHPDQTRAVKQEIDEKSHASSPIASVPGTAMNPSLSSSAWMYTHPGQPFSGDNPSDTIRSENRVKSFIKDHALPLVRIALQSEYPKLESRVLARNFVYSVVRLLIALSHSGGWDGWEEPFEALWVDLLCPDWPLHLPQAVLVMDTKSLRLAHGKPTDELDFAIRRQHDTMSDNDLFMWRRSVQNGELVDVFQNDNRHPCTGRVEWEAGSGMQYHRDGRNVSVRTQVSTSMVNTVYCALRPIGSLTGAAPVQSIFSPDQNRSREKEYQLNELVDVRYGTIGDEKSGETDGDRKCGDWKRGRICEFRPSSSKTKQSVRIHAILSPSRSDLWLPTDSEHIVPLGMWRGALKPGDQVDHLDGSNRWYPAIVIEPYQLANETDNRPRPANAPAQTKETEILSREERFAVRLVTHVWLTYPGYHSSYDVIETRDSSRLARPGTFARLYNTPLETDQLEEMVSADKRLVRNTARRLFPEMRSDPPPWDILRRPTRYQTFTVMDSKERAESKRSISSPKKWLIDVYNAFHYRPNIKQASSLTKPVVDQVAIHLDQLADKAWQDEAARRFEASR